MDRLLPHPFLSGLLGLSWMALAGASVAHALLALVLAVLLPLSLRPFLGDLPRVRAPVTALRLLGHVLWDIAVANVVVARLVLGPADRLRPAFLEVPLSIREPYGITLLATIITTTPGTVSVALTPDARILRIHALDVEDPVRTVDTIKRRYEQPLKEILGC